MGRIQRELIVPVLFALYCVSVRGLLCLHNPNEESSAYLHACEADASEFGAKGVTSSSIASMATSPSHAAIWLIAQYEHSLNVAPVATKSITAACVAWLGDLMAQYFEISAHRGKGNSHSFVRLIIDACSA